MSDLSPDDINALRQTGQVDQGIAALLNLAKLAGAYRTALMQEGFTRTEAVKLAGEYVQSLLHNAQAQNKGQSA